MGYTCFFVDPFCYLYFMFVFVMLPCLFLEKVSEYDQEIPHSQTADQPTVPEGELHDIDSIKTF